MGVRNKFHGYLEINANWLSLERRENKIVEIYKAQMAKNSGFKFEVASSCLYSYRVIQELLRFAFVMDCIRS